MEEKDFSHKLSILRGILSDKGADALFISNQNHFSWLTGGRGFIGIASVGACAGLIITQDNVFLIAENIEAKRLWNEQLGKNPQITVLEYPWHCPNERQKRLDKLLKGKKVLTETDIADELFNARTVLTQSDIARYRDICKTTALELEATCRTLKAGMTEYEVAGELSRRLWSNNLEPITLLIGFDERAVRNRHPVPVGAALKNYALIAVCARRNGLIASATRLVSLTRDPEMMERQKAAGYVDAVLCANTVVGADTADVFQKGVSAYAEKGFEGEWKFHHQGGLTGFVPRELKAMSTVHHTVRAGEAYGWNPSVQGAKSENTILVTENGYENLTHTGDYPYLQYEVNGQKVVTEDILILDEE